MSSSVTSFVHLQMLKKLRENATINLNFFVPEFWKTWNLEQESKICIINQLLSYHFVKEKAENKKRQKKRKQKQQRIRYFLYA